MPTLNAVPLYSPASSCAISFSLQYLGLPLSSFKKVSITDGKLKTEQVGSADIEVVAKIDGKEIVLKAGKGKVEIENPKLWWVRGYGEQPLYEISAVMEKNGHVIDKKIKQAKMTK